MQWIDLMHLTDLIPQTATEKATAGADALGVVMTTIWMLGASLTDINAGLHTAIAGVTLVSVTFSLYIKVKNHKQNQP